MAVAGRVDVIFTGMEGRLLDQGYIAADFQLADVGSDFESFYNISSSETKKLTQLTAPGPNSSFYRTDLREHAMDLRGFSTGVSVEESALLDDAIDFFDARRDRDRSNFGSLTELSFSSSLTELDNLPRSGEQQSSSAQQSFKLSSYDQEQENRFPGNRRIPAGYASTSHHPVGSKSLKVMKQKQGGLSTNDNSAGTSILRQQLQGIPCSNKYRKAQETLCKDCGKPYTTKCLLQVCRKSDEVLCPICGQELTAKCLLQSCSTDPRQSPV